MNPTGSQRAWMSAGYICPTSEAIAAVVSAVETAIGTPLTEVALASGPSSPLPAAATADVMIVRYPRLADPKFSSDVFAATSEVHCHCWPWSHSCPRCACSESRQCCKAEPLWMQLAQCRNRLGTICYPCGASTTVPLPLCLCLCSHCAFPFRLSRRCAPCTVLTVGVDSWLDPALEPSAAPEQLEDLAATKGVRRGFGTAAREHQQNCATTAFPVTSCLFAFRERSRSNSACLFAFRERRERSRSNSACLFASC